MSAVADRLDSLGIPYVFVGGSIVNLLLDEPTASPSRPTDDVDVIIELSSSGRYSDVEASLRRLMTVSITSRMAPCEAASVMVHFRMPHSSSPRAMGERSAGFARQSARCSCGHECSCSSPSARHLDHIGCCQKRPANKPSTRSARSTRRDRVDANIREALPCRTARRPPRRPASGRRAQGR